MAAQISVFGQYISIEALLVLILSAAVFGYVVRELFFLFVVKSFYIWAGLFLAVGGFAVTAWSFPSDLPYRMRKQRKPFKQTFRHYAFTKSDNWSAEVTALTADLPKPFSLYPESFLISGAVDRLIEYVIRDFVLSWYKSVSPDPTFPAHVENSIRLALYQLINRAKQINWPDLIVTTMVPVFTEHFRKFTLADLAVREKSIGRNLSDGNEFQYAIALQYSQGLLHPALVPLKHYQYESYRKNWLRKLSSKLVPLLLGDTGTSNIVNNLTRDILACSLLFPILTMLSDPDYWNQLIVKTAGTTLQDRKKVEQLRQALNEHATLGRNSKFKVPKDLSSKNALELEKPSKLVLIGSEADKKEYEKFILNIQRCNSLNEVKKLRYEISQKLQSGIKDKAYNKRLSYLRKVADKQIAYLSKNPSLLADSTEGGLLNYDPRREYTLSDVFNDPICFQSFMEFMSLNKRKMLVQFWLTMNSLRNPLGDNNDEEYDPLDTSRDDAFDPLTSSAVSVSSMETNQINKKSTEQNDEHMRNPNLGALINENDIYQIYNAYFNKKMPYISDEAQTAVQKFVESPEKTPELLMQARKALVYTQNVVYKALTEEDLVNFKKSDVFLNFLASTQKGNLQESTIDSLQMDSISDYEEPTTRPNEKDVEDFEKVFDFIMSNKVNPNNMKDMKDAGESSSHRANSASKLVDLLEEKRGKRSGPAPLFEDSEGSDLSSESGGSDEMEFGVDDPSVLGDLHLAAPGDLGLIEAINILTKQIKDLYRQEQVLDPLLRKAELTNNVGNLRILRKSKASLEREIQRKELQRQQYIVQESDNSLYGRSNIMIRSYMTAQDSNGPFILYIIEVERYALDGSISAGWVVARRYSQFFQLHQLLQTMFPQVRKLPFPKKRVVLKFQQKSFVDARRIAFQKYLKSLLSMPDVCRSKAFRMFLSSETFSIDSVANTGKPGSSSGTSSGKLDSSAYIDGDSDSGVDDFVDVGEGNLSSDNISGTGNSFNSIGSGDGKKLEYSNLALEAEAEMSDLSNKPFIQPICDLFIQLFGFDRGNNWVRGRAVVVVVQQILGGTIERKLREAINGSLASEQTFAESLDKILESFWPSGASFMEAQALKAANVPERTGSEKMKCKHDARVIIHALIRDACVNIVGSTSSKYAAYHLFEMFQHEKLNAHLVYSLLDILIEQLFPEI